MRKGAGLAALAIAALYQANKMKKKRENKIVATQDEVKQDKPKRKTPVEVIKQAEGKLKQAEGKLKQVKKEVTKIIEEKKSEVIDVDPNEKTEPAEAKDSGEEIVNQEVQTNIVEKSEPDNDTVYIVGSGKKYHLTRDCRGVKKNAEITEMSLANAIDNGYSLCGWEDK